MEASELASYFDHTLLKPTARAAEIERLCHEAMEYGLKGVCVNTNWLPDIVRLLKGAPQVLPVAVVGFPLGAMARGPLLAETEFAVRAGAKEIDMVLNVGRFLDGEHDFVANDIRAVVDTAGEGAIVKVILETGYLSDDEIAKATRIAVASGAHFVKTSTGFGPRGATVRDIEVMHAILGELAAIGRVGIKASGGIKDLRFTTELIKAGATRIGASASVAIMAELG